MKRSRRVDRCSIGWSLPSQLSDLAETLLFAFR